MASQVIQRALRNARMRRGALLLAEKLRAEARDVVGRAMMIQRYVAVEGGGKKKKKKKKKHPIARPLR
jgi:hypothetical protein